MQIKELKRKKDNEVGVVAEKEQELDEDQVEGIEDALEITD